MPGLSFILNVLIAVISIGALVILARGKGGLIVVTHSNLSYYTCSICVANPPILFWKDIVRFEYHNITSGKGKKNYYRRYLLTDNQKSISFYEKLDPDKLSEEVTWENNGLSGDEGIYLDSESCKSLIDTVTEKARLNPVPAEVHF